MRAALTTLQNEFATQRANGRAALNNAFTSMGITFIIALGVLLIAVLGCAVALRMFVVAPLSRLRGKVGLVADGDFAHSISAAGLSELRALGRDVDVMRVRIVDELSLPLHSTDRTARPHFRTRRPVVASRKADAANV